MASTLQLYHPATQSQKRSGDYRPLNIHNIKFKMNGQSCAQFLAMMVLVNVCLLADFASAGYATKNWYRNDRDSFPTWSVEDADAQLLMYASGIFCVIAYGSYMLYSVRPGAHAYAKY